MNDFIEDLSFDPETDSEYHAFRDRMNMVKDKADEGDILAAMAMMGILTMYANDSRESRQQAYHYASIVADAGHPSGYFSMAGLLRMDGGAENERKAEEYLREAIKLDHIEASGELGAWLLKRGENLQEACDLLKRALSRKCYDYARDLFNCYKKLGKDADAFKLAQKWAKKRPEDTDAHFYLGFCYMQGEGTARNARKGVDSYRRGYACKDARCALLLATAYYTGNGTGKNPAKGLAMLQESVDLIDDAYTFDKVLQSCLTGLAECAPPEDLVAFIQAIVARAEDADFLDYIRQFAQSHGADKLPPPLAALVNKA